MTMTNIYKSKFLKSNANFSRLNFEGVVNNDPNIVSTISPLFLSFKALTTDGNALEFTIYGEAQGDLVTGYGFAELELDKDNHSPLYLLSRFTIMGSATKDRVSLIGTGDLRNIYQLAGIIDFNINLSANNSIIDQQQSTISGFLQYEKPSSTLTPVTMKRLPNSLYNKNVVDTNIGRLLRAYDKEILRARTRIKMIETDAVIDLARHVALINNFRFLAPSVSPRSVDIEDYRKILKKIDDIILLEDHQDMLKESIRFFTDAEPEIIDLSQFKMQLGSSQLGINSYAADRDLFAFTTKILIKNPHRKKLNRKVIVSFLRLFAPIHVKILLQFEDGEIIKV